MNKSEQNPLVGILAQHILGLAHIGFIVEDLQLAIDEFVRVYGIDDAAINVQPPFEDEATTRFAFIDVAGVEFELIEPISDHFKAVLLAIPSGGAGINHVAYRVDNLEKVGALLTTRGIRPGHVTPDGIVDFGPKKMLYLNPEDTGGLVIELIEVKAV